MTNAPFESIPCTDLDATSGGFLGFGPSQSERLWNQFYSTPAGQLKDDLGRQYLHSSGFSSWRDWSNVRQHPRTFGDWRNKIG